MIDKSSTVELPDRPAPLHTRFEARVQALLARCGLEVDGSGPADPKILHPAFFSRVLACGSLGLGESYMDGWWNVADLDEFLYRLVAARLGREIHSASHLWAHLRARFLDQQSGKRAYVVGRTHYDLGNDLFKHMLGKRMVYSCGYWRDATELDEAQEAKLDLVCRKLGLQPGMRVLDIGCGWGEALKHAADRFGVHGVGITISQQQAEYAADLCKGLPIEIRVSDYREINEAFDAIFSIGMFEHVGSRHYRDYFEVVSRCLKPDGLSLLHAIGTYEPGDRPDPWIEKYIFPNSQIPSATQIAKASEGLFVIEDWHNFGADYERTLQAWNDNFDEAWPQLSDRYDARFRRMWHFYLAASKAVFRARQNQLWQIVMSPRGIPGGYRRIN